MKGFALSLALKQRLGQFGNGLLAIELEYEYVMHERLILHEVVAFFLNSSAGRSKDSSSMLVQFFSFLSSIISFLVLFLFLISYQLNFLQ